MKVNVIVFNQSGVAPKTFGSMDTIVSPGSFLVYRINLTYSNKSYSDLIRTLILFSKDLISYTLVVTAKGRIWGYEGEKDLCLYLIIWYSYLNPSLVVTFQCPAETFLSYGGLHVLVYNPLMMLLCLLPPSDHHKHRVAEKKLYGVEGSSTFLECIPKSLQARVTWTFQKHQQNPREEVRIKGDSCCDGSG